MLRKIYRKLLSKKPAKGYHEGFAKLPSVDCLIDIGIGHQGTYGLYKIFSNSSYIFIDPIIETKCAIKNLLNDKNIFINCAVGNSNDTVEINVRKPFSRSGLLSTDSKEHDHFLEKRKIEQRTLDSILEESCIPGTFGVKIDVEGYEMFVLEGFTNMISKCSFMIIEVPINGSRFQNSFTFEDMIIKMNALNYNVFCIRTSGDGTNHCDIAFVNNHVL